MGTLYYGNKQGQFIKARAVAWCDQWWTVKWAEAHWGITSARNVPSAPQPSHNFCSIVHNFCSIVCTICAQFYFSAAASHSHSLTHSVAPHSIWVTWSFNVTFALNIPSQSFAIYWLINCECLSILTSFLYTWSLKIGGRSCSKVMILQLCHICTGGAFKWNKTLVHRNFGPVNSSPIFFTKDVFVSRVYVSVDM